LLATAEKSSKSAALLTGKIIPIRAHAVSVTTGTPQPHSPFQTANQTVERVMYIGLGGILILILILWLLGVI
jgi:hypothetical protein